jgi:L-alanine-DL-glutamate epimerase-like enolase superfamily enzyme
LAGLPSPSAVVTAYTISLGTPEEMAEAARSASRRPLLKLKLGGPGDVERVRAVREASPLVRLIADANEVWTPEFYAATVPQLQALKVELIEQPFPAAKDEPLLRLPRPIPICADESCHTREDMTRLRGRYDAVNIKLDKAGGLTEALALMREAEAEGFQIMVGCMVATSLAMAPAMLLAARARYVDLDGPLLLAKDREPGLVYHDSSIEPPSRELWG